MKNKTDINRKSNEAFDMLLDAITKFVRANGGEMNDYYRNEFGLDVEDKDSERVICVLDVSCPGCSYAVQDEVNDDSDSPFTHHSIWALYIVRDNETGEEKLKFYEFYNSGTTYDDDSEPDHDYVCNLTLADLWYIIQAIGQL